MRTKENLLNAIKEIKGKEGPLIIVVRIKLGSRSDLKIPEKNSRHYKEELLKYLTKE